MPVPEASEDKLAEKAYERTLERLSSYMRSASHLPFPGGSLQ